MTRCVAPHWGAWIEIGWSWPWRIGERVAPHWGAWIEMDVTNVQTTDGVSHPTGVRGLKLTRQQVADLCHIVAPHWGAWIEIITCDVTSRAGRSHPTGVRGLKYA